MKDPAFLLYAADFLVGVFDFTMEERGQYITLMCLQHQKGHLSEESIRFCVGSLSDKVLSKFVKDENGLYYNERLEQEIEARARFAESRRNNGKKGGRPKLQKTDRLSVATPTDNLREDENENTDESENTSFISSESKSTSEGAENACPFEKIKNLYNTICVSFPKIRAIEGERKKAVQARWRMYRDLDKFQELFTLTEESDFLKGQNGRNWSADFDWLMKPGNFVKVLERKYENRTPNPTQTNGKVDTLGTLRRIAEGDDTSE